MIFKIKFLQQVLDKKTFLQALSCRSYKVAILNKFYKTLTVIWTSLGPLPRWVPGPTTRWAPGTTRLALHGT
jgi:hypothetical protein